MGMNTLGGYRPPDSANLPGVSPSTLTVSGGYISPNQTYAAPWTPTTGDDGKIPSVTPEQSAGLEFQIGRQTAETSMPSFKQAHEQMQKMLQALSGQETMPQRLDTSQFGSVAVPELTSLSDMPEVGMRDPASLRSGLTSLDPAAVQRASMLAGDAGQKQLADIRRSAGSLGAFGGQVGSAMAGGANLAAMAASRAGADEQSRQEAAARQELQSKQQMFYDQDLTRQADLVNQMRARQEEEYAQAVAERERRIQEEYALRDIPLTTMMNLMQMQLGQSPANISLPTSALVSAQSAAQQADIQRRAAEAAAKQAKHQSTAGYIDAATKLWETFGKR